MITAWTHPLIPQFRSKPFFRSIWRLVLGYSPLLHKPGRRGLLRERSSSLPALGPETSVGAGSPRGETWPLRLLMAMIPSTEPGVGQGYNKVPATDRKRARNSFSQFCDRSILILPSYTYFLASYFLGGWYLAVKSSRAHGYSISISLS